MPRPEKPAIETRQGAGGESAYIAGTRVRVSDIARLYALLKEESMIERIQRSLPSLTVPEIEVALEYWRVHKSEVESEIAEEEALFERVPEGS